MQKRYIFSFVHLLNHIIWSGRPNDIFKIFIIWGRFKGIIRTKCTASRVFLFRHFQNIDTFSASEYPHRSFDSLNSRIKHGKSSKVPEKFISSRELDFLAMNLKCLFFLTFTNVTFFYGGSFISCIVLFKEFIQSSTRSPESSFTDPSSHTYPREPFSILDNSNDRLFSTSFLLISASFL